MVAHARVTSIEEERTRSGERREREAAGFIQVPRSILKRCKKLTAGEWAVLVEVLNRGVSWGRYEPQKIKIEEFCEASGLTKQAIADGISRLAARGVLYEERLGTSKKSATKYAIIDAAHPASGPSLTPEGTLAINLLGGLLYPVNSVFLKSRNTGRNPTFQENESLNSRNRKPKKQENESLNSRKTNARQPAQEQAPYASQEGITKNVIQEQREEGCCAASDEACTTASACSFDSMHQQRFGEANRDVSDAFKANTGTIPPTAGFEGIAPTDEFGTYQPALLPVVEVRRPAAEAPGKDQKRCQEGKGHKAPKNPLYALWCAHAPPPATARECVRWNIGLKELMEATPPVAPDELPRLIALYRTWRDKDKRPFALNPQAISANLTQLREELVYTWIPPEALGTALDGGAALSEAEVRTAAEGAALEPEGEEIDPIWAAQLRRFVPDMEGVRDGHQQRDVQMLWGFVRDELRPGLNTARRQHLDALVPAWHPANPRELLLLSSTSYTVRFINMALLREINEQVGALLSRFFDQAKPVLVPRVVIEQVVAQGGRA